MKNDNQSHQPCCSEYAELSRRKFLKGTSLAGAAGLTAPAWLPKVALARTPAGVPRDVIMLVSLRGAIDGLSTIVPYGDPNLYLARPNLAVPQPGMANGAIDLDGFFGVNPNAAPLMTLFNNGHLAVFHAAGSTDPSRSHFDAMTAMDGGVPGQDLVGVTTGWLGRHLAVTAPTGSGLLRGLAVEDILPLTLDGGPGVLPVSDPANFGFPGRPETLSERARAVQLMYGSAKEPLGGASISTFETIDLLNSIDFGSYVTAGAVPYPGSVFGQKLRVSAALIKAGIDIEAISIDYTGWDHHNGQGPINGVLAGMLADLTGSLEAFYLDLLADNTLDGVTGVVLSEFGRRVAENSSLGTDHGHGNMMLAFGAHIAGQVYATWPGLAPGQLDGGGDLAITIDYRDVLAEILEQRAGNTDLSTVFPSFTPTPLGITV